MHATCTDHTPSDPQRARPEFTAALILTGGRSRRMGSEKYRLRIGGETVLQRIIRITSPVASAITLIASAEQDFAAETLPHGIEILRDSQPGRGPLPAVVDGMQYLIARNPQMESCYVLACDMPLVTTELLQLISNSLRRDDDAVVPFDGNQLQPLCGLYRTFTCQTAGQLLARDCWKMTDFCDAIHTRRLMPEQMISVSPDLQCLMNMNTPEDYERILQQL
ncbi:MAG: molybdenum cofactor guanylyltransferase [Planctomycetaceae bacterium]|nr:molybdenum cofactor guanylyltransferase [Planctomycetaceae bacterium]